jgi:hypothetical protein
MSFMSVNEGITSSIVDGKEPGTLEVMGEGRAMGFLS